MSPFQTRALRVAPWIVVLLLGCGDTGSLLSRPMNLLPPAAVGRSIVFIDPSQHVATMLNADDVTAEPTRITLPNQPQPLVPRPQSLTPRPGGSEALVLCRGASDDPRSEDEAAALVVLSETGEARRYPLDTRFNSMTVSDDGRYAMLFFRDNDSSNSFVFNPNEVAVIDLDRPFSADDTADPNPYSRTLRSFGNAPTQIVFSPELTIAGEMRRLAVVLYETGVLFFDLDHLDRPEYTIELATSTDRTIDLAEVVFDAEGGRLYLRGDSSSDVYVITLTGTTPTGTDNDFAPSLNQLGIGAVPLDMALYTSGVEPRLLAITAGSQAVVVDANTSRTTAIPLPVTATSIQIYRATSPSDPVEEPRAVLYDDGGSTVMFLDLRDVEERRARNLETLSVGSTYSTATTLDARLVLLTHTSRGLSVLNIEERTASPISSTQNLSNAVSDTTAQKLWLAPPGQSQLGFLDLADGFHPGAINLSRPITSLVQVDGEGLPPLLAVVHSSTVGHITMMDRENPTDLTLATATRGFLLQNILDRAEEETP